VFVQLPLLNFRTNRFGGWNINMTMMPQPDLAKEPGPHPEGLVTTGKTSQRLDIPLLTLELKVLVLVNEREVGFWEVHNDRGGLWQEYEYAIPAEFITANRTTSRIDAEFDPGGPGFTSYRYWIYAP
jgi:hypothetical protein